MAGDAQELIEGAFRFIHINAPDTTDLADGLIMLNDFVSLCGADRLLIPYMTSESFTLTAGTNTYTIGASGNFNTVRPMRIESAYIRDSSNVDYSLDVVNSKKDYNLVSLKGHSARPEQLTYSPIYPIGKLYFYPTPSKAETVFIDSLKQLTEYAALTTATNLPLEYKLFIKSNLAVILHPIYKTKEALSPSLVETARMSKAIIETVNARIPSVLKIDNALLN